MKRTARALLALTLAALIIGCEPGPPGPPGPAGAANLRVVTFTLNAADFVNKGNTEVAERPMPELTSEVVQGGAVLAYEGTAVGTPYELWEPLPYSRPGPGFNVTLTYYYSSGGFAMVIKKNAPPPWPKPSMGLSFGS